MLLLEVAAVKLKEAGAPGIDERVGSAGAPAIIAGGAVRRIGGVGRLRGGDGRVRKMQRKGEAKRSGKRRSGGRVVMEGRRRPRYGVGGRRRRREVAGGVIVVGHRARHA